MSYRSFTGQRKQTLDLPHSIEPLESRIAPAGAVLTTYDPITGALAITGDGEANGVKISKTGSNAYRIEGVDTAGALPTTIDGEAFQDVGKITSISFDMGGGDDVVAMVDVKKLKSLDFAGGAGNDTFEAENLTTKGSVDLALGDGDDVARFTGIAAVIGGNLVTAPNAGGSRVEFLAESNTVHQLISLTGGDGNDGLFLGQDSALRAGRGVIFLGGSAGNDFVELDRGSVVALGKNPAEGLSLRFEGSGSDADRVLIGGQRANLLGGIRIVGSNDTVNGDQFVIGARTEPGQIAWAGSPSTLLKIGKNQDGVSVSVDGLAGDDSLSLEANSGILLGGLVYAAGEGNNEFRSAHSDKLTIGKIGGGLLVGRSIHYTGGAGNDVLDLKTLQFMNLAGFVAVTAGDGENQLNVDAQNLLKIGKTSVYSRSIRFEGGAGGDSVNLNSRKISVAGYVDVVAHGGDDLLKIQGMSASFGTSDNPYSIAFESGTGDDRFELTAENVIAAGLVHMRTGLLSQSAAEDNDHFSIDAASFQGMGVNVSGSKGDDTLEMNVERLSLSGFEYHSGGGSDSIAILADGRIKNVDCFFESGVVSPNPGQAVVNIGSLSQKPGALVLGSPTFTPELRWDFSVKFLASGEDGIGSLTLQNITFGNRLSIATGAGNNTVSLDNIRVFHNLAINTGSGDDVVEFERGPGSGPSKITRLAGINLGEGDDIVRIGSSTESPTDHRVRFLGGLELIGGDGTDSRNADLTTANEIVGTPVIEIEEQDA